MPLCVACTQPVPHLYIVYESAHNVRLEQCPACHAFADPYAAHDTLIVLLDLILLKRGVFRHLLFNRGAPPRRVAAKPQFAEATAAAADHAIDNARWALTLRVGLAVVFVDSFIRWSELRPQSASALQQSWTLEDAYMFARVFLGCLVETIAFHAGVTASSFVVLSALDWLALRKSGKHTPSFIRQALRYSHIPLCLLYSSATKFFLLLLLAIWDTSSGQPVSWILSPPQYAYTLRLEHPVLLSLWSALDDDTLDRRWVIRNVLGGMAAGFGLRVVLDCHPAFTTIIILAGWALKAGAASLVSGFVGRGGVVGEAWLEYSIP